MSYSATLISPSDMERRTGLGKDQLRKWRQRFGFPLLESTPSGKTAYSIKTIGRLVSIKRLLDAGFRPGQVVGTSDQELEKLKLTLGLSAPSVSRDQITQLLIEQLKQTNLPAFKALLTEIRAKHTLGDFVLATLAPLLISLGDAWMRNEIDIHHEHLCTCIIERYLHAQILELKPISGSPQLLLALPPGEHHSMGLLMFEAILAEQGAQTINIGADIPLHNLRLAAVSYKANVVALSFSFHYPARRVIPTLLHLRRLLPAHIQIWAGGAGLWGIKKHPKGVHIFSDLKQAVAALHDLFLTHETLIFKGPKINTSTPSE